tara:strand:- start:1800 stop:1916 length:117 start_codon:yes stop_codon:yes gene_type:complete
LKKKEKYSFLTVLCQYITVKEEFGEEKAVLKKYILISN